MQVRCLMRALTRSLAILTRLYGFEIRALEIEGIVSAQPKMTRGRNDENGMLEISEGQSTLERAYNTLTESTSMSTVCPQQACRVP